MRLSKINKRIIAANRGRIFVDGSELLKRMNPKWIWLHNAVDCHFGSLKVLQFFYYCILTTQPIQIAVILVNRWSYVNVAYVQPRHSFFPQVIQFFQWKYAIIFRISSTFGWKFGKKPNKRWIWLSSNCSLVKAWRHDCVRDNNVVIVLVWRTLVREPCIDSLVVRIFTSVDCYVFSYHSVEHSAITIVWPRRTVFYTINERNNFISISINKLKQKRCTDRLFS